MSKVRSVPNKQEVQQEQEKETENKQMGSTGEKDLQALASRV